eukprot:CAMPEP_0175047932 /NCGR_PEP_ID=MMETSP0052_2-20121109/5885_1 /TAXON_ID=51329 ORGANISM="Polytomella parva, Strain SAG 63-3" /NCGR_SAMPLE_ID=MMETSP0052_2 /ASSEMBLY_ACC=CAM_ASM_000194 /LENGTH=357 /DNA_ID=CAMNT_0016311893 /DNA_START=172 /DNA_END=1245 /DNA_ORIENTATION=-
MKTASIISKERKKFIPLLIHQVYYKSNPDVSDPISLQNSISSFKRLNRGYTHILWITPDIDELFEVHAPSIIPQILYTSETSIRIKKMMAPFIILYLYGGVYVDVDLIAVQPILRWYFHAPNITGIVGLVNSTSVATVNNIAKKNSSDLWIDRNLFSAVTPQSSLRFLDHNHDRSTTTSRPAEKLIPTSDNPGDIEVPAVQGSFQISPSFLAFAPMHPVVANTILKISISLLQFPSPAFASDLTSIKIASSNATPSDLANLIPESSAFSGEKAVTQSVIEYLRGKGFKRNAFLLSTHPRLADDLLILAPVSFDLHRSPEDYTSPHNRSTSAAILVRRFDSREGREGIRVNKEIRKMT